MLVRSSWPIAILLGVMSACATTGQTESDESTPSAGQTTAVVTGSVAYRERMALPPDAVVHVSLIDASRMDAVAPVIAETTIVAAGKQVPIPYTLRYDRSRIDATHSYAVRAVIRSGERMLFTTNTSNRVITQGNPTQANLQVVRVSAGDVGTAPSRLTGTAWVLEDLAGTSVHGTVQATLEFADSAKVSGNASCNRFFGTAQLSGADSISFGGMGTTRMACPDSVSRQEASYLKALQDAERFRIEDSALLIFTKGTAQPLRFRKR